MKNPVTPAGNETATLRFVPQHLNHCAAAGTVSTLQSISTMIQYTECPRRKGPNFGRVLLRSDYTDITQNTYIQSSMVTEILAREV